MGYLRYSMFKKIQRTVKSILSQEYTRASAYYVAANIIGQGVVLLSSSVFTRLMSQEDYGLVSTYSTWVLVINTFICLNLFITVRNAYIDFKEDYDRYNSSVLLLALISGVLITGLIMAGCMVFRVDFSIEEILFACMQSIALNVVNYMLAAQSMKNQYKQRVLLMILPNWGHTILSIIFILVFTQNMYMAKIAGNAFGMLIFGGICIAVFIRKSALEMIPRYWKYALKISVPSIFNTLSDLMLIECDRLMLTFMVGAVETAEYSIVYNAGSVIVAIYQAVNGAWIPWFFKKVSQNDSVSTKKYQTYYMLAFTVFACGMMTIMPELIKILAPENYWRGICYAGPIVTASYLIFLYAFFTCYLTYQKRTGVIARNTIIVAVLNLILNYIWIPRYKSVGAVMATVTCYLMLFFLHYFTLGKKGKDYFAIHAMWRQVGVIAVYAAVFYLTRDLWLIRYGVFLLFVVIIAARYGKEISGCINELKKDY